MIIYYSTSLCGMISPAVYFDPVPLTKADVANIYLVRPPDTDPAALGFFLPSDNVLQAAGFVSDRMLKLMSEKRNDHSKALEHLSVTEGNISDSESVSSDISGLTGASPRSGLSTPHAPTISTNKLFGGASIPFPAQSKMPSSSFASQSFDALTPKSTLNTAFHSFEQMTAAGGSSSATADPSSFFVSNAIDDQSSTGGGAFDDMFAGFSSKPPVVPIASVPVAPLQASVGHIRSDVLACLEDQILCLCKAGKVEKFDYLGILTVSLGNDSFPSGIVHVDFHDPSVYVKSYEIHHSVVDKTAPDISSTDKSHVERKVKVVIPATKKAIAAVKLPYVRSFRPMLFQVRTSTVWEGSIARITVRITINPAYKQYCIEKFSVSLSMAGLCLPGSSEAVPVTGVLLKPNGTYNSSSNVASWSTARLNPLKDPQISLEAAVNCRVDEDQNQVDISAASVAQLPVIVRGKYTLNLFSGVDHSIKTVEYIDRSSGTNVARLSRDFDLNLTTTKMSKFEYRFM